MPRHVDVHQTPEFELPQAPKTWAWEIAEDSDQLRSPWAIPYCHTSIRLKSAREPQFVYAIHPPSDPIGKWKVVVIFTMRHNFQLLHGVATSGRGVGNCLYCEIGPVYNVPGLENVGNTSSEFEVMFWIAKLRLGAMTSWHFCTRPITTHVLIGQVPTPLRDAYPATAELGRSGTW